MYLRPTCVATDPFLGVGVPQEATLYVIASPVGPYFPDGFKPITVVADTVNVRAWPGGAGDTKIGGNYAPTIKPVLDAAAQTDGRAQQVLFLFGDDHRVTEVGSMNVFVVMRTTSGVELVTAPLSGDILPGVTRRSILDLARADPASVGVDVVSERVFTMPEVVAASRRTVGCSRSSAPAPRPSSAPCARSSTRVRPSTCPPAATRAPSRASSGGASRTRTTGGTRPAGP